MTPCGVHWPLCLSWSCFEVIRQAVLDLERALKSAHSTGTSYVFALCQAPGIDMIWAVVSDLGVQCRSVWIKLENICIAIYGKYQDRSL